VLARCAGYKRNGEPCSLVARADSEYCWAHAPENAEQRSQNAARAGRARGPAAELCDAVTEGRMDKGKASVAFQGFGVLARFIEVERRVREQEEFEERLTALEQRQQKGGDSWWTG
jgi:hypothetical protein